MLGRLILSLIPLAGAVFAQQSTPWTDPATNIPFESYVNPVNGIRYSIAFPSSTSPTEFVGEIAAPISSKWVGWSLGPGMNGNLLLVAWPNGNSIVGSARMATGYTMPTVVSGPTLTTIAAGSGVNATHWKWLFRCQGCTSWTSPGGVAGSMNTNGVQVFGWAQGTTAPATPANPASTFTEHQTFGNWAHVTSTPHFSNYDDFLDGKVTPTEPTTTATGPSTTTTAGPVVTATPYDYIVVGAGASGIIVADRLSEAGKKVLLIERGGPSTAETGGTETPPWPSKTSLTRFDIPGLFESMFGASNPYWWCDDVQPFAGCLVGGGAAINGLLYWYPTDAEWATSNGWPSGWQTPNSALEKVKARLPATDTPSTDGKRYLGQVYDVVKSILDKQNYSATTINNNVNAKDHVYGHPGYYVKGGKRTGPMDTYLKTAKARSNFKLLTNTKVLSLVRNGAQITGVQTDNKSINGNGIIQLTSKGRVILSAGPFGTAKILFGSGVGPADQIAFIAADSTLSKYLPPSSQYINLPVGLNVKDNPSVNLVFTHPTVDSYDNWAPIWASPRVGDANQYVQSQAGVFAGSSPRINFWRAYGGSDGKTRYVQGTSRPGACCFTPTYPYNTTAQFTITMYLSTGLTSTGRIGLDDASLRMRAITKPWFTDPVDKAVMVNAINDVLATYKQVPNLALISPDNVTSTEAHVTQMVDSSNHWVGSTKIGTSSSNSVVDANTKVWNTNNLFVVDSGIMPGMPMGNPQGAIFVMAENAVAKILALSGGA
ncbi:Cellobiose dehydrogenase OS=Phanerochaete chrysosporium GN=CDH-1 PE=1 SV=1 [Rhizoctonia solani AG-1 IB]|uniref:Cellobiose dehydrogenase n=1 Tax=Thanatephorus cucumeris (strain AG1-IB / isolate 7/3/14) TaxID=1108050 RepID=A0A0B7FUG0_THACB|nr:Cellobiose dehydrogenase OS=Phanerochaete chrysosporium GN=CDH-1 PE=1 SV=1 [Rhizoctonia solani AG-1 IB]